MCASGCMHANVIEGAHVCRDRNRCLHLMASSGRYNHLDGAHGRVPFGCYKIGRVAAAEELGFLTNDVTHDPRVHNHNWALELGLVSFAGYRLLSHEREPIGVLALFSKKALSPKEETLLQTIAGTVSTVLLVSRTMEAQRESEEKYRILVESTDDLVCKTDRNFRYLFANNKYLSRHGLTAENLIGRTYNEFHTEEVARPFKERINEVFETGKSVTYENKDAQDKRYFIRTLSPIKGSDGKIIAVTSISKDITEHVQIEDALRESEEKYKIRNCSRGWLVKR